MIEHGTFDISKFYVVGINYKKTDAAIRGKFAVHTTQYASILSHASKLQLNELFVLSTCNRTEIYGFAASSADLISLLCDNTSGDAELFSRIGYVKYGNEAILHLFEVGAGLDSQILGDYEIIGQIKQAAKFSKEHGFTGPFTERLINCVLQASKEIKNQTRLSTGTVSVAFAAVQYISTEFPDASDKKVLLIGTGKIGGNTCRNLLDYVPVKGITLINRSLEKAASLAKELKVQYSPIENLTEELNNADIIVVATNAEKPIITNANIIGGKQKLIIDLSIPYNVDPEVAGSDISLINVDHLSKVKDETLQARVAEIPKAKSLISFHLQEFYNWNEMRRHVPYLKAAKVQLQHIHSTRNHHTTATGSNQCHLEKIQKVINGMAVKMQKQQTHGCHFIEAINEFITPGVQ